MLEADQGIGQAEKGQIASGELVPANEEPPIAIEPGVQPFHHPAPWTLARLPRGRLAVRFPGIFMGALISFLVTAAFDGFFPLDSYAVWYGVMGGMLGGLVSGSRSTHFRFSTIPKAWKRKWHQLLTMGWCVGLLTGIIFGVIWLGYGGPSPPLHDRLIYGTCIGLGSLLVSILIEAGKTPIPQEISMLKTSSRWWHWLVTSVDHARLGGLAGLLLGLSYGLGGGLTLAPYNGLPEAWDGGVGTWLHEGLRLGITALLLSVILLRRRNLIEPVEIVVWSTKRLWRSLTTKGHLRDTLGVILLVGLVAGLGQALGNWLGLAWFDPNQGLENALRDGPITGLATGLSIGLIYWILFGLWDGISRDILDDHQRIVPNQGIRQSVRISVLMGLIAGGLCGLIIGGVESILLGILGAELRFWQSIEASRVVIADFLMTWAGYGVQSGLLTALIGGLFAALLAGGLACLRHYVLRFLLWRTGSVPWRYAQFLDYAAERILLRKVGGGYIFIHSLLLDYFASLAPTLPTSAEKHAIHHKN